MHGGYGENGDLQSFLDDMGIYYTGSKRNACEIAISKHLSKKKALELSIPTAKWCMVDGTQMDNNVSFPLIVKPDDQGSTIGLSIVENELDLIGAIKLAKKYSNNVLIEEYIPGREITIGIIDNVALPIVEIIPNNNFYNYKAKYTKGKSKYICPAIIDKELTLNIKEDALKIFKGIGCQKYARVDFRLNETGYYFLELNTHPGMTSTSLLPMAALKYGIDFVELIKKIIKK